jgi:hypothetical protein
MDAYDRMDRLFGKMAQMHAIAAQHRAAGRDTLAAQADQYARAAERTLDRHIADSVERGEM